MKLLRLQLPTTCCCHCHSSAKARLGHQVCVPSVPDRRQSCAGHSSSPAQAAVSGLLRVAARESSGQQFAHILHHTCATQALQLPLDSTDLFGVGLAGKLGGGVDVPAALLLRLEYVAV